MTTFLNTTCHLPCAYFCFLTVSGMLFVQKKPRFRLSLVSGWCQLSQWCTGDTNLTSSFLLQMEFYILHVSSQTLESGTQEQSLITWLMTMSYWSRTSHSLKLTLYHNVRVSLFFCCNKPSAEIFCVSVKNTIELYNYWTCYGTG